MAKNFSSHLITFCNARSTRTVPCAGAGAGLAAHSTGGMPRPRHYHKDANEAARADLSEDRRSQSAARLGASKVANLGAGWFVP